MNNDINLIMKETSRLIKACFEKKKLTDVMVDAEQLIHIAETGKMQYLLLYPAIGSISNTELLGIISDTIKYSTFTTLKQIMCAKRITELLEKEHIRHQMLKGAVLKNDYPSVEMREMSDIDLVIFDEMLDRAAVVLENNGFINHGLEKHHMIFSSVDGVVVEVHWCLFDQNADSVQYIHFKEEVKSQLIPGYNYTYEFSREDFYIYMIAHMSKHFFETGCGIRNLLDIYVYLNKYDQYMDRSYINSELKRCGIFDFEKNMKKLAYIWMDQKECSVFYTKLFSYMLECGIYGESKNGVWGQLAKETKGKSKTIKLHYYFPSLKFMKEKYEWVNSHPYLLPVAWGVRGLEGFTNKISSGHASVIRNTSDNEMETMLEIYHRMNLNFRRATLREKEKT